MSETTAHSEKVLSTSESRAAEHPAEQQLPSSPEKAATNAPTPSSLASDVTAVELGKHTLGRRPWRLRTTPFSSIYQAKYAGNGTEASPFIVEWLPNDPEDPQTYSDFYKWMVTGVVAVTTLAVAFSSSAFTAAGASLIRDFHTNTELFILGTSVFVLGFAYGPLLWGPAGEVWGRRNVFIPTFTLFTLFNGVGAASPNIGAVIVFRFFAGSFGSSPLANAGGTIADMFGAKQRGLAMAIFAAMPFLGPALGPISGGFIGDAAGWRWVEGFLALFTGALTILGFFTYPETYAPVLLRRRAALLSKLTGAVYRAPMDAKAPLDLKALMKTSLGRPWVLLFSQPIVLITSIYMSLIYATLYMLFASFPIVFEQGRGWSAGISGLAFLGIAVGMLIGVAGIIFYENPRYIRVADAAGGRATPEDRLPCAIFGSFALVIGLAWFAATCGPSVHWMSPIAAGAPFGLGMVLVFLGLTNYLIDTYVIYAASVLAANSLLRSIFGAAFPLFVTYMYANLGIHWGSAVPGFLALACLPFPILFYKYGRQVREKSAYARRAEAFMQMMMAQQVKRDVEEG